MKVVAYTGKEEIAMVYIVEFSNGRMVECVEAVQPPLSREEKWVLLVSTLYGCPVGCGMCDAGGYYQGKLSADEILEQIDFLVSRRFSEHKVPSRQFKVQFSRMGEPALNMSTLIALERLKYLYQTPGLIPSLSTIAPAGRDEFFEQLLDIKQRLYLNGAFQFQFSIHTTDNSERDRLIPVRKWDLAQMAHYGERFYQTGDRKITLNFALSAGLPVDEKVLARYFSPDVFLIKITPLNPTYRATENKYHSAFDPHQRESLTPLLERLESVGYEVILAIGELEENRIGSNCGQYLRYHLSAQSPLPEGYQYPIQHLIESI